MKRIFYLMIAAALLCGCDEEKSEKLGGIYGVVTNKTTAEPMRATGVELYTDYSLLTRTVTYDDGHYEFTDLQSGNYTLKIAAENYATLEYNVVVESGKTARGDMQLEKVNTYLTVRTLDITEISTNFATLNGTWDYNDYISSPPNECGFVYATHSNPANGGTKITAPLSLRGYTFSIEITNLSKANYYVQAYAKNSKGTEYGEERSFQITGTPLVITLPATNVAANSAVLNGKVEYQGDPAYTERGFVYSSSFQNPTIEDSGNATVKKIVSGTSTDFSANVAELTSEKIYYARAYLTNGAGTVYGQSISFMPTEITDYVVLQSDGIMVQKNDISSGANWRDANNLCKNSRVGGYSDWRLPTLGELKSLYNNRTTIGGFATDSYWSSTESSYTNTYYYVSFGSGYSTYSYYDNTYRVRAVRTLP